jgi:hypothetical protein
MPCSPVSFADAELVASSVKVGSKQRIAFGWYGLQSHSRVPYACESTGRKSSVQLLHIIKTAENGISEVSG